MKYYVIEVTVANGAEARAITPKADINDAIMVYHQVLASARANGNVSSGLCMAVNSSGGVERSEAFTR